MSEPMASESRAAELDPEGIERAIARVAAVQKKARTRLVQWCEVTDRVEGEVDLRYLVKDIVTAYSASCPPHAEQSEAL